MPVRITTEAVVSTVHITLASGSPRRRELLALSGLGFTIAPARTEETRRDGEAPRDMAVRLAIEKASAASDADGWVLAADTVVVHGEEVMGKPADAGEARRMLQTLCGRDHQVVTAIALRNPASGEWAIDVCETTVPMRPYAPGEFESYVERGEPFDKAGAYAIQDRDFQPVAVDRLRSCFANVMGLPLCHLVRTLRGLGIEPPRDVPAACMAFTGYDCPVFASILEGRA